MTRHDSTKAVVLLSGGIDSAACAYFLLAQGHQVRSVFVDHGQLAAAAEYGAAMAMSQRLGIHLTRVQALGAIPSGTGEIFGRNAFLLVSAMFLLGLRSGLLGLGIHSGTPYRDCSPQFIEAMQGLLTMHTDGRLRLIAPFLEWKKQDVLTYFMRTGLPLELTYSCESGMARPCGQCASCGDRRALGVS